ncbi:MAG: hypothetical protein M3O70_03405, partial [Actinomycetota bacterium]|nr:hypothetical protein [Actinomycetota bacterium]
NDGVGEFFAYLTEHEALGQVLLGDGLTDAKKAEVHLVIRWHGPPSGDIDTLKDQLNTLEGAARPVRTSSSRCTRSRDSRPGAARHHPRPPPREHNRPLSTTCAAAKSLAPYRAGDGSLLERLKHPDVATTSSVQNEN